MGDQFHRLFLVKKLVDERGAVGIDWGWLDERAGGLTTFADRDQLADSSPELIIDHDGGVEFFLAFKAIGLPWESN